LKRLLIIICFVLATAQFSFAQSDIRVEFEGRYWITDLTAEAKVTEEGIGTEIDFQDDLGLGDENFPEGRFTWYPGPNSKIRLAYTQIAYDGDKNAKRTIEFAGETYTVGTRVITDLELKYLRVGWIWEFINIKNGTFKCGTVLEGKVAWIDASLDAPNVTPAIKESENLWGGLPTIGIAAEINPHSIINIFGEISGMTAGKYGYFIDGEIGVKIIPIRNVSVIAGYRVFDIKAKDDPDFAKLKIGGFFSGLTARF
jgi:hypothetical protein